MTNTYDVTSEFLQALKDVNAKEQKALVKADSNGVDDAEIIDVTPKRKRRVQKKLKELSDSNGKAKAISE